jgi:hypothetical protein
LVVGVAGQYKRRFPAGMTNKRWRNSKAEGNDFRRIES